MSEIELDQSYRDSISTVSKEGKRLWVYPKKPKGKFYNARTIFSIFLLAFLIFAPFIKLHNHPLFLLNIIDRKFILFGLLFGPQDFYIFVIVMIATIVFIFLFTAIFGRVFCGWACPQTVFMEMVFRKIEYFIEGDFRKQIQLNKAPWTGLKFIKKFSKWIIFYIISFFIANILLAWVIGVDDLFNIIKEPVSAHFTGFFIINIFTLVFFFIFAWFREQACTIVCPYGRLQGVLLDNNSVVIAYDNVRGEPRGKLKTSSDEVRGDCIDCYQCVDVCPTGIDIRNGTQLECVNCTACIDACDIIMDKIEKPRGLIRYASINNIISKTKFKFTPRIIIYSSLLAVLLTIVSVVLANRDDVAVTVLRAPGMLFYEQPGNNISNLYNISINNRSFDKLTVTLKLEDINGEIKVIGNELTLESSSVIDAKFMVLLPKEVIKNINTPLNIGIYSNDKKIQQIQTNFLGPKFENKSN